MKKTLAIFLATLMFLSMLTACGGGGDKPAASSGPVSALGDTMVDIDTSSYDYSAWLDAQGRTRLRVCLLYTSRCV